MATIDELIRHEINPFDRVNLKPGNFWGESAECSSLVVSIHQEAIADITTRLDRVAADHISRTLLLVGDSGAGKSYLLDRLKQTLNDKAFFAYIGPWADSTHIWRHVLRYTVDSLMQVPKGRTESQLLLWLKGLSVFTKRTFKQRIFDDSVWGMLQSDRQKFIAHLKKTYRTANIHSPDIFFGVLHDLTDPELYPLACEWLRGDDLSEVSMQLLRLKRCVDSEDAAKTILANISKIATDTQPIVLCFDNLDNIPRLSDGTQDFQALFNVNTIIHNDGLKNFLIVISIVTDTWNRITKQIKSADRAGIDRPFVQLKRITLDQAEALWVEQLKPLHHLATPRPKSAISPLTRAILEEAFPGGKAIPRSVIILGKKACQHYKIDRVKAPVDPTPPVKNPPVKPLSVKPLTKPLSRNPSPKTPPAPTPPVPPVIVSPSSTEMLYAEFKLEWEREHRKTQTKITKLTLRSAPELIQMVQETLIALGVSGVKPKLLTGAYASYSLQYEHPHSKETIGLFWTEDASMQAFYHVMNACQKVGNDRCQKLQLLRTGSVGEPRTSGNQIYRQLFVGTQHQHIKPSLASVQDIATYHSLVNAALAKELLLAGQDVSLKELESLVRETQVLQGCRLLQDLGLLPKLPVTKPGPDTGLIKNYLMNLMVTQSFMGRKALIQAALAQFSAIDELQVETLIEQLCQSKQLQIVNPNEQRERQTICWLVNS
jgi:AAA ATPase domain